MDSGFLKFEDIDVDGAIRETRDEAVATLEDAGDTRADLFKKAGLAGGAALSGGALLGALVPGTALAGNTRPPVNPFGKGDIGILNFALTLEYLEQAFYNEATRNNRRKTFIKNNDIGRLLKRVNDDENVHVQVLKRVLGKKSIAKPKFDFGNTTRNQKRFIQTTFQLENTGVHAYLGQLRNIQSAKLAVTAGTIVTVEARHAAVAGLLFKRQSSAISIDGPFDVPFPAKKVISALKKTGFITAGL